MGIIGIRFFSDIFDCMYFYHTSGSFVIHVMQYLKKFGLKSEDVLVMIVILGTELKPRKNNKKAEAGFKRKRKRITYID